MHRQALPRQSHLSQKRNPRKAAQQHPHRCFRDTHLSTFFPLSCSLSSIFPVGLSFPSQPSVPVVGKMLQEFTAFFIVPEWDLNILIPLKTDKLGTLGLSWFRGPDLNGWGPLFPASPGGIKATIGNLPLCVGGWGAKVTHGGRTSNNPVDLLYLPI